MTDLFRTTISMKPEVAEIYRSMAKLAGMSLSRCIGEWLADTADGAQLVASKMREAKTAPVRVMKEMQSMLEGSQAEVSDILGKLKREGVRPVGAAVQPTARRPSSPPSSNTGGNSPGRTGRKP